MIAKSILLEQFSLDVTKGLSKKSKSIPSKYFYDEIGSKIFEEIMTLPEYYLSRCETEIFNRFSYEMAYRYEAPIVFVELGSGDGSKTKILLDQLWKQNSLLKYIPVDISRTSLAQLNDHITEILPALETEPLFLDFTTMLPELVYPDAQIVLAFLGSSMGNWTYTENIKFLKRLNRSLKSGDEILLGLDLVKDFDMLKNAYDDSRGVTAKFNLNLLSRMNNELGANFDLDQFKHYASYHPGEKSMQSHLISKIAQTVYFKALELEFVFKEYESIFLERSCKYSMTDIKGMADQSGFVIDCHFEDTNGWFIDIFLRKVREI